MELIIKDPGTCGKTVWTHTILLISSWVLECIMEVGGYDVDGLLGADPQELYLVGSGLVGEVWG